MLNTMLLWTETVLKRLLLFVIKGLVSRLGIFFQVTVLSAFAIAQVSGPSRSATLSLPRVSHIASAPRAVLVSSERASLSSPSSQVAVVSSSSSAPPRLHRSTTFTQLTGRPDAVQGSSAPQLKTDAAPEKKQMWNLENADILAVVPQIAKLIHKNFIVDPRVSGKVSVISTVPMTAKEIYQVFLASLQSLTYDVVPVNSSTYRIVPAMEAKYGAPLANVKSSPNEVVVRVVPVVNVSAQQLEPILRPLLADSSLISAYMPSNSLIISGHDDSVNRLQKIIHELDQEHAARVQIVRLKNASATTLVAMLKSLQTNDQQQGRVSNVSYAADTASNSILVSGVASKIVDAKKLIARLDVSTNAGSTTVIHLNYLDATKLASTLQGMLKQGGAGANHADQVTIQGDKSTNTILVHAAGRALSTIHQIIKQLDVKPQQVLVQAIIAQVDESMAKKLGIEWGQLPTDNSMGIDPNDSNNASIMSQAMQQFSPGVGTGVIPAKIGKFTFAVVLHALNKDSLTNVLSTPSVMVTNNNDATLSDGKDIQIPQSQSSQMSVGDSGVASLIPQTTYTTQHVDLTLKVTPQISPDNMIRLKISQKNDQLSADASASTSGGPTVDTSQIDTNVMVRSGDILVLGGLIKNSRDSAESKIPILGDIPLIGRLFRNKHKGAEKKSLMVFLRPMIMGSRTHQRDITRAHYNYVRADQAKVINGEPLVAPNQPMLPAMRGHRVILPSPFGG